MLDAELLSLHFESCLFPSTEFDFRESSWFIHSSLLTFIMSLTCLFRCDTHSLRADDCLPAKTFTAWPEVCGQLRQLQSFLHMLNLLDLILSQVQLGCWWSGQDNSPWSGSSPRYLMGWDQSNWKNVLVQGVARRFRTGRKTTNSWKKIAVSTYFWLQQVQQSPAVRVCVLAV